MSAQIRAIVATLAFSLPSLVCMLAMPSVLVAQEGDEHHERTPVSNRFDQQWRTLRDAREPLAQSLRFVLDSFSAKELVLLGTNQKPWYDGGQQPPLYRAFVADSSFEPELAQVLDALHKLLRKAPALAREAPWQALLARAQLDAGQPIRARASARRAWSLDHSLCDEDCSPLLRGWLEHGVVRRPKHWPQLTIPEVYQPASTDCVSDNLSPAERKPFHYWKIPEGDLVLGASGARAHQIWMLRRAWGAHLRGCDAIPFSLVRTVDQHHTSVEVQNAFARAQADLRNNHLRNIHFLGAELPMPRFECNYASDPSCIVRHQRLSIDSALWLAQSLRSFTNHLRSEVSCRNLSSALTDTEFHQRQSALDEQLKSIEKLPPHAAGASLLGLIRANAWLPVWRYELPFQLQEALAHIARGGYPELALQVLGHIVEVSPEEFGKDESTLEALALVRLRMRQPKLALDLLTNAHAQRPQLRVAHRIAQLGAALAGADLRATRPDSTLARPWIAGDRYSERAVVNSWRDQQSRVMDGVLVEDVLYAMGGAQAVARYLLHESWVPWLLGTSHLETELHEAMKRGYPPALRQQMIAKASSTLEHSPRAQFQWDGATLELPDQYCTGEDCQPRVLDRDWLSASLYRLFEGDPE